MISNPLLLVDMPTYRDGVVVTGLSSPTSPGTF